MSAHEHFKPQCIRIEPGQAWCPKGPGSGGLRFVFTFGGAGTYQCGAQTLVVGPNDLLVLNLESGGSLQVSNGSQMVARSFSVGLEQLFSLLSLREICQLPRATAGFKPGRVYPAESALAIECHRRLKELPEQPDVDRRSRLLGIMATVLSTAFKERCPAPGQFTGPQEHLNRLLEQFSVEDFLRLPVEELARRVGCSRRHLNRQFQHHFGCSVQKLRLEIRLMRALALLRDPQAKVTYVAELCRFGDLGSFNVAFRRRFGFTPSQWRRLVQGRAGRPVPDLEAEPPCCLQAGGPCPWSTQTKSVTPLLRLAELVPQFAIPLLARIPQPTLARLRASGRALASIALVLWLAPSTLGAAELPAALAANLPNPPNAASTFSAGTNLPVPPATSKLNTLDDAQKLAIGDKVSFRVLEDREDPKALTISDTGELDVPELGLIRAAGKSCKELALEIKRKLEETTYYQATVIIGIELLNKTLSGRKVYVVGEVRRTGPQEIPAGESWTLSKAILRAGGFTEFADQKRVRLVRAGDKGGPGQTFTANVREVWAHGRLELDLPIQPDDLIYVPERTVRFY